MAKPPSEALVPLFTAVKEGKDALIEMGNVTLDAATQSDVFGKFPVIKAIVGVVGFCDAVMSHKLQRNIKAFLEASGRASPEKVDQLYQRVVGDPRFRDEIPDTLIQVMIDSHKPIKAEIVGRLFKALAEEQMSVDDFNELSLIVVSASVPALLALPRFIESNGRNHFKNGMGTIKEEPLLFSLGIASRSGTSFRLDELGILLYEAGFGGRVAMPREQRVPPQQ